MRCQKCGKSILKTDEVCSHCGSKTKFGLANIEKRNPVLNSPDDISNVLLQRIIDNNLDTLTINYEFSVVPTDLESDEQMEELRENRLRTNPFAAANQIQELRRIEFEIILGENVRSLAFAFMEMDRLEYVNLTDTSHITDMRGVFAGAFFFNQPIGSWDTSKVTSMEGMFAAAFVFNQPIGDWDTSKVTSMEGMFEMAFAFNQPIGDWDTSNVACMDRMFDCSLAFNQPIGNWNTTKVASMKGMFKCSRDFNQPIGNWDITSVTDMSEMFMNTESFNQPLDSWDITNIKSDDMFLDASAFDERRPKNAIPENVLMDKL